MNPVIRNILAVLAGLVVGSAVNMGLILFGGAVVPPPPGVDVTDMASLEASMHLFEAKHFAAPFFAHALGTLAGAWLAALIAASSPFKIALGVGIFFLLGGTVNAFLLSAPAWFVVLDLAVAYIPTAWLGYKLSGQV